MDTNGLGIPGNRWSDDFVDVNSPPGVMRRAVRLTIGTEIETGNPTIYLMLQNMVFSKRSSDHSSMNLELAPMTVLSG